MHPANMDCFAALAMTACSCLAALAMTGLGMLRHAAAPSIPARQITRCRHGSLPIWKQSATAPV